MSTVIKEIMRYKKYLVFLFLATLGEVLGTVGIPSLMRVIIDVAYPNNDVGKLVLYSGIMLILAIVAVLCGIVATRIAAKITMGVGQSMRQQLFEKVQYLSQSEIDHFSISALITRTNNDITQIQNFLNICLYNVFLAPLMFIFGAVFAMITDASLASVLIIAIPVLCLTVVFIGKIAIPLSGQLQKKMDKINCVIREKLTGVRVIRAFGTNSFEEKRFDGINDDYTKTNKKLANTTNLLLPIVVLIVAITISAIVLLAKNKAVDLGVENTYTQGKLMSILQYVLEILMAVILLTIVFLMLPRASACAVRAKEVLNSVNEINEPENPQDSDKHGYLTFENVSFSYKGAEKPALNNLSFEARPGETTAIIGGTGAGKTTIVNLIPRLYDVSEGRVLVDGIDVRDYDISTLRSKIGFVPQKAIMFSGTIDSNIAFGGDNPTEDDIEHAVKIAQSYDFVMNKDLGFEDRVSQGGTNFSGGQRQRLCIARAIVKKPEIYVFDDSFSALDFKTDRTLRQALKGETDNATVVIVAQRVSTIMEADRIIVIDGGNIMGIGTHEELCKTCPTYKEIVDSQMKEEN